MTYVLPPLPPESETGASYFLVTPLGLAMALELDDAPLRMGQYQTNVHRAAFSFFQARTDDGLPTAGEAAVKVTLRAASPEGLQVLVQELRVLALTANWLTHLVEGSIKLLAPTGVDVGASSTNGRTVDAVLHLAASDLRRYAADGSVMT